ncbi:vWA domain-containing protein [Deinococcus arenicola]|uniref:VWA domain-containing protein n=1 Tax=Deinococcus arenicola TaxID=2994950 RepID=A0ABU4DMT9_9DEIO|nr:vWA domain-containing protein [Deinococcus sp. ZS9-10]MDV6373746.1 VWA domain-containing protein [Deinococcus sp. ZS9-10]
MQPAAVLLTLLLSLGLSSGSSASVVSPASRAPGPAEGAACTLPAEPLPTHTRAVFVLDTSGSMRGLGDGRADVFGRVRAELNRYVRRTLPDRVELLTFDAGLRSPQGFDRPTGTQEWNTALRRLKANGSRTYLYRSLWAALEPLNGGGRYVTTVFLITDGIDNDWRRPFTAAQALDVFATRGPFDRLHYLALGTTIPGDAHQALNASAYADGQTIPLDQIPWLDDPGLGSGLLRVAQTGSLRVPFADGTRVRLTTPGGQGLRLVSDVVTGGRVDLTTRGGVPYGMAALLCPLEDSSPPTQASATGQPGTPQTETTEPAGTPLTLQRVLLRLNVQPPLTLLNPGADLTLAQGEQTALRYRAVPGVRLDGPTPEELPDGELAIGGLPSGLAAQIAHVPGSRELSVRLTNLSLTPGQTASLMLTLPGGVDMALPTVRGGEGGRTPSAAAVAAAQGGQVTTGEPTTTVTTTPPTVSPQEEQRQDRAGRWDTLITVLEWVRGLVLLALALGALAWLLMRRRRRRLSPRMVAVTRLNARPAGAKPAGHDDPPAVEGIEYSENRGLSLVTANGERNGVSIPLGGSFDLGQLARVPHLSGLRAEQHRDGLQLLRIPADLEVSEGGRLVGAGEVMRPGTLLGITVARTGRAPNQQLGSLTGLGQPLNIRHEAATVRITGPYGQHAIVLPAGLSDLGAVFDAPALGGLNVTLSGPQLLLVALPERLVLRRRGEPTPLQPGSYLSGMTLIDLPEDE